MGLFDFVKDAGERIFGKDEEKEKAEQAAAEAKERAAEDAKSRSLTRMLGSMGFLEDARVVFDDGKATIHGTASSQADREKSVLVVGNTQGVAQVDDQIKVEKPEPEAKMYTVQSGDSLSKISKEFYGDAMKYNVIFEANTPMLKDPNKIYPGQVLRIPPLEN